MRIRFDVENGKQSSIIPSVVHENTNKRQFHSMFVTEQNRLKKMLKQPELDKRKHS